jgi:hypothetical protein
MTESRAPRRKPLGPIAWNPRYRISSRRFASLTMTRS